MKEQHPKKGKVFETRRAAFRAAKRDHGIPVKVHPPESGFAWYGRRKKIQAG